MARVTQLALDPIRIDHANAIVDVHVDVTFSRSDKDANTPYTMVCRLRGDDSVPDFGEDLIDDVIPDGIVTPPGGRTIRADGLDVQTFDFRHDAGPGEAQRGRLQRRRIRTRSRHT